LKSDICKQTKAKAKNHFKSLKLNYIKSECVLSEEILSSFVSEAIKKGILKMPKYFFFILKAENKQRITTRLDISTTY
jgi:hypothetical protein